MFLHQSTLSGWSQSGRWEGLSLPSLGAARKWLEVGIWISGRGALLSLWHSLLPPPFLSQEGQVVAVILQLALATERFANYSGMQIPPASLAWRMPLDPLSLIQAVSQPGFLSHTRVVDSRRR